MENVFQLHCHQRAAQPSEAQTGYAREILEVPNGETESLT